MFKFKIGQHVWFLPGSLDDDEDLDFLHGTITRRYTEAPFHGSPDACYEIRVDGDGIFDIEEEDLYGSLAELHKAVTEDLRGDIEYHEDRVREIRAELKEALTDISTSKRRLKAWQQKCNEGRKQLDQDMRDPNVFYFC